MKEKEETHPRSLSLSLPLVSRQRSQISFPSIFRSSCKLSGCKLLFSVVNRSQTFLLFKTILMNGLGDGERKSMRERER